MGGPPAQLPKSSPRRSFNRWVAVFWLLVIGAIIAAFVYSHHHSGSKPTSSSSAVATEATTAISPSQAFRYVGTRKTVAFLSLYTYTDSAGTEFLDQKVDYTDGFVVLIPVADVSGFSFDPASTYRSTTISVTGTIQLYHEYAEIIVTDPSQIQQGVSGTTPTTVPSNTGTFAAPLPSTTSTTSPDLPVVYRYATSTLNWAGFSISDATCAVGSSGSVDVTGTAVVPPVSAGSVVEGEVEAWLLDASGNVVAVGTPAAALADPRSTEVVCGRPQ